MVATRSPQAVRETRVRRAAVLFVLGGIAAACVAAAVIDVPVATWLLGGLLIGIAGLRVFPALAPVFSARSLAFDLAVLVALAAALAVLAPAGLLD